MKHEDLEEIFVQRHKLAQRIVEGLRESALTTSKHYTLLIGARGIGKTHLVSLVYHRIHKLDELQDRLLIAWLREEEWGVTSFLDLLLRIFRALVEEYGDLPQSPSKNGQDKLSEQVESLYQLSPDRAELAATQLLKQVIGNHTLLLLVENLDEIFAGLGDEGQKQLRAFLQESSSCTILATSQSLFNGVKLQTSPFYGFFSIRHLKDLTPEDATQLLANIARLKGDRELESFILTVTGRDRIQAIHYLAGGNHRVYIILSEFLTHKSLDELVEPFMQMVDDLTPYYQARMNYLSPQQRKIIEFLCDCHHPVPVKEIAQRCFISHQTASSQLKDLRDKGYVTSQAIGRQSYYEPCEVLMRFCLEVKKQRGEQISLFVDFLRMWYPPTELQQKLERIPANAKLDSEYLLKALQKAKDNPENQRIVKARESYELHVEQKDYIKALESAQELVAIRGYSQDWLDLGTCLRKLGIQDKTLVSDDDGSTELKSKDVLLKSLESYDKVIKLDPNDAKAWAERGVSLQLIERYEEAIVSYNKAIELDPNYALAWACRGFSLESLKCYEDALDSYNKVVKLGFNNDWVWVNRGFSLQCLQRFEEAIVSYDKAIKIDPNNATAWAYRGNILGILKRYKDALDAYNKVIKLDSNNDWVWVNRGFSLQCLQRYEDAIVSYNKAIELDSNNAQVWAYRGFSLQCLQRYEDALDSCNKAIEINPQCTLAWVQRGFSLQFLHHYKDALDSYDKAIEINPKDDWAWFMRGWVLDILGHYQEALISCNKAIELGDQDSSVFFNRAIAILGLNYWQEGIAALNDALNRLEPTEEASTEDSKLICSNLLNSTKDTEIWRSRIKTLIQVYDKHQATSALGQGLVRCIPELMSEMISDKAAQKWLEIWQELTSNYPKFQIPLRLLKAAVNYRQTKGDKRALFTLAIEERKILKEVLGIEEY
ncbi:MAG: tetratricopeptide repeat protein [Symploca sp. SIO2E9]|nr:tetratricopeptide repeat protein [Symploca sp. SIO2E9]